MGRIIGNGLGAIQIRATCSEHGVDAAGLQAHTRRMAKKSEPQVWKIYARQSSNSKNPEDYADECYKSRKIAIGWSDVGDLNRFDSCDALKPTLEKLHRTWFPRKTVSKSRVGAWAGCLWRFKDSVKKGHYVLCPDKQEADRVYVGRVLSKQVSYDESPMGRCEFAHRRKVQWFRPLNPNEVRSIWKGGHFGGRQTVTKVRTGFGKLSRFLRCPAIQKPKRIGKVSWHPDKKWGRLVEIRALRWLGKKAKDVAHLNLGWDIECDGEKFEVKGRKSGKTAIRLTQNEWKAAKKFGKRFIILVFTAPTPKKLNEAEPWRIPDPARTEKWNENVIVTREYFLNES
jgi:hypothetical protein